MVARMLRRRGDRGETKERVKQDETNSDSPTASQLALRDSLQRFQCHSNTSSPSTSPVKRLQSSPAETMLPTASTRITKKRRTPSRYAPPAKYAHLPPLQDVIVPNLICVFIGTNPGIRTATAGHAYAHPSNSFWKLLHSSGCTDVRLSPSQDVDLPRLYCMGNTNIVSRPSKDAAELSKAEMAAGTPILDAKCMQFRPEAVCIVGKGIWEAVWRWRHGRELRKDEFHWGWQSDEYNMGRSPEWAGSRVFVTSSTSGLSASLRPAEKEAIWAPFGAWVKERRIARFGTAGRLVQEYEPEPVDRATDREETS